MATRNALAQRTTNIPVAAGQAPVVTRKRALESGDDENKNNLGGGKRALTASNLETLAQAQQQQDGKVAKRAKLSRAPADAGGWQVEKPAAPPQPSVSAAAVNAQLAAQQKTRQQQLDQQAALAAWMETYKRKLPTFVFYFDSVPADEVRKTTRRIQAFKGVCPPFSSRGRALLTLHHSASLRSSTERSPMSSPHARSTRCRQAPTSSPDPTTHCKSSCTFKVSPLT